MTRSEKLAKIAENSPKVYEAGKISALKVPASSNSGILTDCLEAPLISLYAEVVNEYSREIVLTSETGETQNVIIDLYGNVYTIELRSDGTVWFEENIGSGIIDFVDYTNTEVGQALKALHTYEGTTYVSGALWVGYYKDVRQAQYEAGEKDGKASESAKIDYNFRRSKKAVLMRGGEIDMNAEIDKLPDAILNIPIDASLGFYEDSETAYQKVVPEGAEEYALLKSLGGMTYKCSNLFDASKIKNTEIEVSENGRVIKMPIQTKGVGYTETSSTLGELCPSLKVGETIVINLDATGANTYKAINIGAPISQTILSGEKITITQEHLDARVNMYGNNYNRGDTEQVVITDFRINHGTTVLPYEPYYEGLRDAKVTDIVSKGENLEPITYPLPEAVQLKAVNDTYYDYIEFDNGRVFGYKVTEEIVLNGSETWVGNGVSGVKNNYFVTKTSTEQGKYVDRNAISDRYDYNKLSSSNAGVGIDAYWSNAFNGFVIGIRPPNETSYTVTSFEKELKNNPVTARVALAEPIVTDITDLFTNFDNFIKVEGGGSIEFVNDYKNAVPSTIKYTVKVGA